VSEAEIDVAERRRLEREAALREARRRALEASERVERARLERERFQEPAALQPVVEPGEALEVSDRVERRRLEGAGELSPELERSLAEIKVERAERLSSEQKAAMEQEKGLIAKVVRWYRKVKENPEGWVLEVDGRELTGQELVNYYQQLISELRGSYHQRQQFLLGARDYIAYWRGRGESARRRAEEGGEPAGEPTWSVSYVSPVTGAFVERTGLSWEEAQAEQEKARVMGLAPGEVAAHLQMEREFTAAGGLWTPPPGPGAGPAPGSLGARLQAGLGRVISREEALFTAATRGVRESADQLIENARRAKAEGRDLEAGVALSAGLTLRAAEAAFEGYTMAVRPGLAAEAAGGLIELAVSPEARREAARGLRARGAELAVGVAAGALGGALFEQHAARLAERLTGVARVRETQLQAVDVEQTIDDVTREVRYQLEPQVDELVTRVPREVLEELPEAGGESILGIGDEIAGVKLTVGEEAVEKLLAGEPVSVSRPRGELIFQPQESRLLWLEVGGDEVRQAAMEAGEVVERGARGSADDFARVVESGVEEFKEIGVETLFPAGPAETELLAPGKFTVDVVALAREAEEAADEFWTFIEGKPTPAKPWTFEELKPPRPPRPIKPGGAKPPAVGGALPPFQVGEAVEVFLPARTVQRVTPRGALGLFTGLGTGVRPRGRGADAVAASVEKLLEVESRAAAKHIEAEPKPSLTGLTPLLGGGPRVTEISIPRPEPIIDVPEITVPDVDLGQLTTPVRIEEAVTETPAAIPVDLFTPAKAPPTVFPPQRPRSRRRRKKPRRRAAREFRRIKLPTVKEILRSVTG